MDCGPACLSMITSFYGKKYELEYLRKNSFITREGVSLLGIVEAANTIGLKSFAAKISIEELLAEQEALPIILHWNQNHFVVLYKISKSRFSKNRTFYIADPAHGCIKLREEIFKKSWITDEKDGILLFLKPSELFFNMTPPKSQGLNLKYILSYLKPYKKQIFYMFFLLLLGSVLTLIFPFLTQNLIDKGVNKKDLNFISIILLSQLLVFLGSIVIDIIRNWLMLIIGTKISITIISSFLKKILELPINFFETKLMGDFNQRIQDNERIEYFLTSQSLLTFFSIITFSVFFGVLWYYDFFILTVYFLLTIISVSWSFYWLKKRRVLDYLKFQQRSENQESIFEIINGVTEMKINQFENFKRNQWEIIQKKLFETNIKVLKLDQIQISGFDFLNQIKNIVVTFLAATLVVKGKMTLGELLSVSYIVGQLNSPVSQLVNFFRSLQDAKLSLERLNEVQNHETEEKKNQKQLSLVKNENSAIFLKNVSFQYEGPKSAYVLKNIDFIIPEGKVTAIVGASGSGKTTLMKLLLKFYEATAGDVLFNSENIKILSPKNLRENCGVVMQDGFIFSDTIERNIVCGDEKIDVEKLENSVKVANIEDFIESLPLGYKTKIGASGNGLSGGQKQRILIARAIYKDPHYIFFDEATSALDAENEKIIHNNLQKFFKGKTVLIIAHRLSTVKNADQIVVLKNGQVSEIGNHEQLVKKQSDYFKLVKNQLELGN
ncbi:putative ABC-type multidrug transport system, ATPase and permease components [Flavobacterium anhuiense]|uniref:Putative ABC-type multidrug transport system, ATPase and permease components n=2 Tax=Flavobacterium anhuiense TaxID=459526 RepID=A0A444W179_9FLAO|nr:putative ABC-type multidrug transport system, ATPase and permease components [Flavobacterium anhuiense]